MLQDFFQKLMNGPVLNQVKIIDGQDKILLDPVEVIDHAGGQGRQRRQLLGFQNALDVLASLGKFGLDSGQKIGEKQMKIIVVFIHGQPGCGNITGLYPTADQRAFSVTGRRGYQGQGPDQLRIELIQQVLALHVNGPDRRPVQFRADEGDIGQGRSFSR